MVVTHNNNKITIIKSIKKIMIEEKLTPLDLIDIFDSSQPRISDLLSFKHEKFSFDILLNYLFILGFELKLDELNVLERENMKKPRMTMKSKMLNRKVIFKKIVKNNKSEEQHAKN